MQPDSRNFKLHSLLFSLLFSCVLQAEGQGETKSPETLSKERLAGIGNHKLFITEKGSKNAKFTVVFESGAGGSAQDWTKVISLLPAETRAIAYDRAGIGKSEAGRSRRPWLKVFLNCTSY